MKKVNIEYYTKMLIEKGGGLYEHSKRIEQMAKIFFPSVYKKIGLKKKDEEEFVLGALLHDIGKTKVSNKILLKNGGLTMAERLRVNDHAKYGKEILEFDFSEMIVNIAYMHHEKPNGSGYPRKLTEIPSYVKFITMLDIFDALVSDRPYKRKIDVRSAQNVMYNMAKCGFIEEDFVKILFKDIESIYRDVYGIAS